MRKESSFYTRTATKDSSGRSEPRVESKKIAGALSAVVGIVAAAAAYADNGVGGWLSSAGSNWPLVGIHSTLTPDGRVLTYGTDAAGKQTGYFIYDVWDPAAGLGGGHLTLDNRTLTDLFCSAQVVLPDGRIFLAGGDNWTGTGTTNTGNSDTNIFSYTDNALTRSKSMNRARWYATTTTLVNGEVYIQGGLDGEDLPEVRQVDGSFRLLTKVNTGSYDWFYPRNFVAPDGRIFGFDPRNHMYYIATSGTGVLSRLTQFPTTYGGRTSSPVMYRPGKILVVGGNSNIPVTVDITAGLAPVVTPAKAMSTKRMWVTATVLADGRVLATGGSAVANELTGVNNSAEIWDPATGNWTVGPSGALPRLYHSTALLLPDASVLVAGGGAPGPVRNLNAEIYYPPYLYTSAGTKAPRPTILSAPDTLSIGQNFSVGVGTSQIRRVTLVKTGAVTHSFNMDQRFLELPFTASAGTLFVEAPRRASDAPPGYYLLFVIDSQGVPSVAKIVRMAIQVDTTAPTMPTGFSVSLSGGKPRLTWSASTDNIGVAGYIVYRSTTGGLGSEISRTPQSSWSDTSAASGTRYYYTLKSYDVAGNVSSASTRLNIAVP